jgi:REP element-mobilizing transposase RayT
MAIQTRVIAHHLILSGYGFWLANDPRGSGSEFIRQPKFEELGAIHHGRKSIQPTRQELRAFYQRANPRLEHTPLWFAPTLRTHIGKAISDFMSRKRYTVWACSVGSNHVHLCIRVHRDGYQQMWAELTEATREALINDQLVQKTHPVWADRPYSVYLHTPDDIRRVIKYIEENPAKEGLLSQRWSFIKEYDGWPLARK